MRSRAYLFSILILLSQMLLANEVGKIASVEGKAFFHPQSQARGQLIGDPGGITGTGDMIRTKSHSSVGIILIDGSKLAIDEKSSAIFRNEKGIDVESGTVVVDIKKHGQLSGFQIKTKTAVIGVKGTQFVVSADNDKLSVYTKEGSVSVESIKGEFKKYRKQIKDEFAQFKQQMQKGFDQYKQQQQREFVGFVKSVDVTAGKMISISGSDLEEVDVSRDFENKFQLLDF